MITDPREHWQSVYEGKAPSEMSWFQLEPRLSYTLISQADTALDARIVDIGGGASTLADMLVAAGYTNVSVLDLAPAAIARARERMGAAASRVAWLAADVLTANFQTATTDVWHDRALFHFLTKADDRKRYIGQVQRAVRPGGHVVVATFAEDGPTRCSGLGVARYSPAQLHGTFGAGFVLEASLREDHVTPTGGHQPFTYCLFRWEPEPSVRTATRRLESGAGWNASGGPMAVLFSITLIAAVIGAVISGAFLVNGGDGAVVSEF